MFFDPDRQAFPDFDTAADALSGIQDALFAKARGRESYEPCGSFLLQRRDEVHAGLSRLEDLLRGIAKASGAAVSPTGFYVATRYGQTRDGQGEDYFGHAYAIGESFRIGDAAVIAEIGAYPSLGGGRRLWAVEVAVENDPRGVVGWGTYETCSSKSGVIPRVIQGLVERNEKSIGDMIKERCLSHAMRVHL